MFFLNNVTGDIYLMKVLNFEKQNMFELVVMVTNSLKLPNTDTTKVSGSFYFPYYVLQHNRNRNPICKMLSMVS